MKKILIISAYEQFGYHTDTYNYCIYLKNKFDITFMCLDRNLPKVHLEGIDVKYIKKSNSKIIRLMRRIYHTISYLMFNSVDLVFIMNYSGCRLLKKIFKNKKMILDIRTTEINKDSTTRYKSNKKIIENIKEFDYITVISEGVREYLNIPKEKSYILPLGGKTLITNGLEENIFENKKLSLIYVGTFVERRIEDTIIAFNKISDKYKGKNLEYNLIGFFENKEEEEKIIRLINNNNYNNINFIGRVKNEELGKYFMKSNIGISYIPITEYFDNQPPTKTYEYLFNGLFTIATDTKENRKIINKTNGILIDDTSDSFYNALDAIYCSVNNISRNEIIKSVECYSWEKICNGLANYINSIINK